MKQLLSILTLFFFLGLSDIRAQITVEVISTPPACWGQSYLGTVVIYGLTDAPDVVTANNQPQTINFNSDNQSYYFDYWFQGIAQAIPINIIENGVTIYSDVFYDFAPANSIYLYATPLPGDCTPGSYITINQLSGGVPPYEITYYQYASGTYVSSVELLPGLVGVQVTDANGCAYTTQLTIPSGSQSTKELMTCGGETALFEGTEYPVGEHTIAAGTASNGCDSTILLTVTPDFAQAVTVSGAGCSQAGLTGTIDIEDDSELSYEWQVAAGGSGTILSSTDFFMTGTIGGSYMWIINTGYCADTTLVSDVQSTGLNVTIETSSTCNDTLVAVSSFGVAPFTYQWSPNGVTVPGDGSAFLPSPAATYFNVTVTDSEGCIGSSAIAIAAPFTINTPSISCDGKFDPIYLSTYNGTESYSWTGPNGFTSSEASPQTYDNGLYTLIVTGATGCQSGITFLRDLPTIVFAHCEDNLITSIPTIPAPYFTFYALPSYTQICNGACSTIPWPSEGTTYRYQLQLGSTWCWGDVNTETIPDTCPTGLNGFVYLEINNDCQYSTFEYERPASVLGFANGTDTTYALTDNNGYYAVNLAPGNYNAFLANTNAYESLCAGAVPVTIAQNSVGTLNIGVTNGLSCNVLSSNIQAGLMRRCINGNYNVQVKNIGNQIAPAPSVTVVLDSFFVFNTSSPLPSDIDGFTLTYNISDLDPYETQNIVIFGLVDCDTDLDQTLCASVHASPNDDCLPDADGIEIAIDGQCQDDSIEFSIHNLDGPLSGVDYIIIEDQIILMEVPLTLNTLTSMSIKIPATGGTYWLGVAPSGNTAPDVVASKVVTGCGASPLSTGFVNQFMLNDDLDESPTTDETCDDVIFDYAPNNLQGVPTGYGAQNQILPSTELDYKIRFQNISNDTAYTLVLRDTLPQWVDMATFKPGAFSHTNEVSIVGDHILEWQFPGIKLPSKNVNEVGSTGHVNFKVKLKANTPLNTVLENSAAIYFNNEAPLITNQTMHTVGINVAVNASDVPDLKPWSVYPNPTDGSLFVTPIGFGTEDIQVEMTSVTGQLLLRETLPSTGGEMHCDRLPAGLYILRILEAGTPVATRKVIVY